MRMILMVIGLLFVSCTSPESQPSNPPSTSDKDTGAGCLNDQVKVALDEHVKDMDFLGEVHGFSGWYGVFAEKGYKNAKEDALQQANDLGATHVVLEKQAPHYGGTEVHGRAYREKKKPVPIQ